MDNLSKASEGMWFGLIALVLGILILDLILFAKKPRGVHIREAIAWTIFCILLALSFNLYVYFKFGTEVALQFLTGYVVEYSLSVDNLFVFYLIFSHFGVPSKYQQRVLLYGILGAIVMRGVMILVGVELIKRFNFVIYIFALILLVAAVKLLITQSVKIKPENTIAFRLFRRLFRSTSEYRGEKLFVRDAGKLYATPLFFVLVVVEATDLVFATDSVPAIFAISRDAFIVFSSNIFAILGLRALYFVIVGAISELRYMGLGLAIILLFVALKMLLSEFFHIPIVISLGIILSILSITIVASVIHRRRHK